MAIPMSILTLHKNRILRLVSKSVLSKPRLARLKREFWDESQNPGLRVQGSLKTLATYVVWRVLSSILFPVPTAKGRCRRLFSKETTLLSLASTPSLLVLVNRDHRLAYLLLSLFLWAAPVSLILLSVSTHRWPCVLKVMDCAPKGHGP